MIASSVVAGLPAGCGGQLAAPDPWCEDPGTDAFLDWVSPMPPAISNSGARLADDKMPIAPNIAPEATARESLKGDHIHRFSSRPIRRPLLLRESMHCARLRSENGRLRIRYSSACPLTGWIGPGHGLFQPLYAWTLGPSFAGGLNSRPVRALELAISGRCPNPSWNPC